VTHDGHEVASAGLHPLGFELDYRKRVFLGFSLTDIAENHNDILVSFGTSGWYAFERPATHFDPDKLTWPVCSDIPLNAKFKRAHLVRTCSIRKCGQESRSIGDVHAFEELFSDKFRDGDAE
jgi:hypothetical protein